MLRLLLPIFTIALVFTACQSGDTTPGQAGANAAPASAPTEVVADLAAVDMLRRTHQAHGGPRFQRANYSFVFRDKAYTFYLTPRNYRYASTYEKDSAQYIDIINNGKFSRVIDEEPQELTEKEYNSGFENLNSVIYFATLPDKLRDPAVNLYSGGKATIKGQDYDVLKVNFNEEGGGVDHDDNFMYWINKETDRIDYLAYDYKTNKGGVRFRSAFNPRVVGGILFQDYVNYKAPLGTALSDLPAMYEAGALEELSIIAMEEVVRLD